MRLTSLSLRVVCLTTVSICLASCSANAEEFLVKDQAAYKVAVKDARPGDVIKLANGTWDDFEIVFTGKGKKGAPITLTAETKGEVVLTGQSNLRIGGDYLEVSGLVFRDGYTPTQEVISFRRDKSTLANNSRVTEIVIDNYSNPERQEPDFWVMMYGKNNRFDHNHLVGKRNRGVTMAVRLDSNESQENNHRIDHNYFGPRPILGSNGGETLRIGTSHHSLSDSLTVVENNYFDRCDGELEIISNKSGRNTFRNNTFFQSRGTLTMRHGNNNLIEGNVFFGNDADHTGGIRVINAGQTIQNNYMERLKGTRFGGALVVMNGVPNSPINRYHQVKDATIVQNSIIDSDHIQLGAGSDEERSAVPIDSRFVDNLIYHSDRLNTFTVYDDMSGITFADNVLVGESSPDLKVGFVPQDLTLQRAENGLLYPTDNSISEGVSRDLKVTTKDMTGVSWYPKTEPLVPFGSGQKITVKPGDTVLSTALATAKSGDTIVLSPGDYTVSKFLKLDKTLTFEGQGEVNLVFERSAMFEIQDGGSLKLVGLNISGAESPDYAGNAVIRTSPYSMLQNYRLEIINSNFRDLDTNHSFNVMSGAKGTMADNILIENSNFENVSGTILKLDKENDDYGIYNAEYVTIKNSTFDNIGQGIIDYYRGGTDESTFGPHFGMTGSTIADVGFDKRNKTKSSIYLQGVQVTNITGNTFKNSKPFLINHTVGEPKTRITNNAFQKTAAPIVNELNSALENTAIIENNTGLSK
ncbi:chondroitinase-B domain-containing protein [Litorimonas sp. RW-G-Af-16]|uniref:chondroitinase-B domain-containing protein n=1 Tax=Litorimonas sp. RW-G-Af-16 TaxID=3241168 RepID=UPI00390C6D4A